MRCDSNRLQSGRNGVRRGFVDLSVPTFWGEGVEGHWLDTFLWLKLSGKNGNSEIRCAKETLFGRCNAMQCESWRLTGIFCVFGN